jgi:hypothetical protein
MAAEVPVEEALEALREVQAVRRLQPAIPARWSDFQPRAGLFI